MAKGDSDKVQNQVDYQGGTAQNNLNNLWGQNTDRTTNFQNLYQGAQQQNQGNYNDVMGAYKNYLGGMPNSASLYNQFLGPQYQQQQGQSVSKLAPASDHPVDQLLAKYGKQDTGPGTGFTDAGYWKQKYDSTGDPYYLERLEGDLKGGGMDSYAIGNDGNSYGSSSRTTLGPGIDQALAGYGQFAQNGGFSPEDLGNIRARSVAPIRGIADNARREISRQAALHPNAANTTAGLAKAARETAYATGDIASNAEANIAQMMQQGKLYGLQGLASTGLGSLSNTLGNRGLDLNAINAAGGQQLGALGGMTSLYGTTPGLTNMFGNQVLTSAQQGLGLGGLQNQLAGEIMNGQFNKAQVPGDFQSALGNIGSTMNLAGSLINPIGAIGGMIKPKVDPNFGG